MNINKFVKKKNGMYSIFLEDGDVLVVHEDLILKYDLLLTKKISDEDKEKILAENLNYIAYSLAIKYITVRQRSRKEIIKYLSDKNVDKDIIDKTVSLLEKQKYINDDFFAESFINDKILLSLDGPYKVKKMLLEEGISENVVDNKLIKFTDSLCSERIKKVATKMIATNRNKSTQVLKNKIVNYLCTLGYNRSLILSVLNTLSFNSDKDIYKKEYDKVYKRLSRKYSGSELEYKVKQKMYALGFTNNSFD